MTSPSRYHEAPVVPKPDVGDAAGDSCDSELSGWGKLGFGSACLVCCSVPMLVVLGLLSAGAAVAFGASILVAVGVGAMVVMMVRRRGR